MLRNVKETGPFQICSNSSKCLDQSATTVTIPMSQVIVTLSWWLSGQRSTLPYGCLQGQRSKVLFQGAQNSTLFQGTLAHCSKRHWKVFILS